MTSLRNILFTAPLLVLALLTLSLVALGEAQNASLIGPFNGTNGSTPVSGLIQLPNGDFLGVTLPPQQNPKAAGTIYVVTAAGALQAVYRLASDGSQGFNYIGFPESGVMQASDGKIYGIMYATTGGDGLVYRFTLPAGPFEVLHSFSTADPTNGLGPAGSLVQALDGNLYGVCSFGGDSDEFGNTYGTIFRVGLDGSFATVYRFSFTGAIGSYPSYGLVLHPNGLLYGTVFEGVAALYSFDPSTSMAEAVVPSVGTREPAVVVGLDAGLYLTTVTSDCGGCAGQIVRYGTDGSGPIVEFTFPQWSSQSSVFGLNGTLVELSDGTFAGGAQDNTGVVEFFRADPVTQTFSTFGVAKTSESEDGFLKNITQGSSGGIVGTLARIDVKPTLGAVAGLFGSLPKPLPAIYGFYPGMVSPGGTFSILGNYLVGTQSVTMNGQSLAFSVKASGAISVTAPLSKGSGMLTVSSPGGKTTSTQVLTVQ